MKTLLVMRHAKSSWKDKDLDDFDRPLNKRGRRDAPFMGRIIGLKAVQPGGIISSPAVRALTTARMVAEELAYPADHIRTDQRLYEASARQILDIVREWSDPLDNVMLVAHNPGLTHFVNVLAREDIDNIPTSGIAAIDLDIEHWSHIREGKGRLRWFEYPKKFLNE